MTTDNRETLIGQTLGWRDSAGDCVEGRVIGVDHYPDGLSIRVVTQTPEDLEISDLAAVLADFAVADEHTQQRDDLQLAKLLHSRGVRVVVANPYEAIRDRQRRKRMESAQKMAVGRR